MIPLHLEGDQAWLLREMSARCPSAPALPAVKRKVLDYQLLALYWLARQYDREGARILEIGTLHGGSGYMLAKAAPRAHILSLTASEAESAGARRFWQSQGLRHIETRVELSWDLLAHDRTSWDMVFIDGDHNAIARDLPWFDRLREGGLLVCHDYSPQDSRTPSGIVYAELNRMAELLGRPFDVRLVDEGKVGMAGFYRRAGETYGAEAPAPAPRPTVAGGIVLHKEDRASRLAADRLRLGVAVSGGWELPWPRTLFIAPSVPLPTELLEVGFGFLARGWDLAAPFSREEILAEAIGTPEDRERTRATVLDLRVPVYCTDLLFVREGAGQACVERWRQECDGGGDERMAFLRALAAVKPRFCVLPRAWLQTPEERAQGAPPPRTIRPLTPARIGRRH